MKRPDSFILRRVGRVVFVLINIFAVYLLLRGHNLPGGGFIAGLASAISLVLLSLAIGPEAMDRVLRFDPVRIATGGLALSLGTAMAPIFFGLPLFTHSYWTLQIPFAGQLETGTPLVFDFGIYLVVLGACTKIIAMLTFSSEGHGKVVAREGKRYASVLEEALEEHGEQADAD